MKATTLLAAALFTVSVAVFAQAPSPATGGSTTATPAPVTEGEVRKIDKDSGKLTLRHGPIQHFEMPAMTMIFRVADPKMLDELNVGDKVRFSADRTGGGMTVTSIEKIK